MRDKKQPKKIGRGARSCGVVQAVLKAVLECQAKADFDYQRIIVCIAGNSRQREELTRECRVAISRGMRRRKESRRCGPIAVLEEGWADKRELLVAAVQAVNQRRAVVVLVTSAEAHGTWRGRWEVEAGRIARRTHVVLRAGDWNGKNDG